MNTKPQLRVTEPGVDTTPTFYFSQQPMRGLQPLETLFAAARAVLVDAAPPSP